MARIRVGAAAASSDAGTPAPSPSSSSTNAGAAAAAAKTRRTHRKSRNGCAECKRRHIRCDEGKPACTNCTIAERVCSFPSSSSGSPHHRHHPPPPPHHQHHRVAAASSPQLSYPVQPPTLPPPLPPVASPMPSTPGSTSAASSSASLGPLLYQAPSQPRNQVHLPSYHHLFPPPQQHPLSPALSVGDTAESPARSSLSSHTEPQHHRLLHPSMPPLEKLNIPHERLNPSHSPYSAPVTAAAPHPPIPAPATFTAQHLALLHHAENNMTTSFFGAGQAHLAVSIAIRHVSSAPYLIDQLLALTAMHIIFQKQQPHQPHQNLIQDSISSLHNQATELQTRALNAFTRETGTISASGNEMTNYIPRFLFSAFLSIHVLAECLSHDPAGPGFHEFIDRFVECIALHGGVRSVIKPDWQSLMTSELYPMLSPAMFAKPENVEKPGNECEPLDALMNTSDLSPTSIAACREAIKSLQWAFNWQNNYKDRDTAYAGSSFAIVVSEGFTEVLRKHHPEALIILAYYGVLLHRARRFWVFGSSGSRIIRAVAQNLSSFWQEPMKWPLDVIATEVD
ncbi:hypothetical protein B0I35DRAFT_478364 [Stachybotrys elegans]|uniref:Zn(2)-C6 fungal-type domain-containing protein n=1 Tax=Stachybotrys elegans TaxID=80388 RepID=A0A8K0WT90_9HYPO|nr:hypothetical protein B0I35DRAFT_478364 [Stachybotrys elegans]